MMATAERPQLEPLEDRLTPSTFGAAWPDPQHLTFSFAPDGTPVGASGNGSQLFQLNAGLPASVWQGEVLRALQTWASVADVNFGLVADTGRPLGSSGAPQGDPRFGDVRLATYPMTTEAVAVASPFDVMAGTHSGDILLNRSYPFTAGGTDDLYTVLLHEAGHVLGLPDNTDPTSVMFGRLTGVRAGLSAQDVAAVQAVYGPRQPDAFDAAADNGSMATATVLQPGRGPIEAELTTPQDVDVYQFRADGNSDNNLVRLQTSGLSLLAARLSMYDSSGQLVQSAAAAPGGDLSLNLSGLRPGSTYFVKVEKARDDVFGVGAYRLALGTADGGTIADRDHGNHSAAAAINLLARPQGTDGHFAASTHGTIASPTDVDFYRLVAPRPADGSSRVLTVTIWSASPDGLQPRVDVYGASGSPVAATVLANEGGTYTVQVPQVAPGAVYYLVVRAAHPDDAQHATGKYSLAVDLGSHLDAMAALKTDHTLSATNPSESGQLHVGTSQLLHFALDVGPGTLSVLLTITDAKGNVVATLTVRPGETATLTQYLAAGDYVFRFAPLAPAGLAAPVHFSLRGAVLSDAIGPDGGGDTTLDPNGTTSPTVVGVTFWQDNGYYLSLTM